MSFNFAAARPLPFDDIDASDSEDDIRDVDALLLALKSSRGMQEASPPSF